MAALNYHHLLYFRAVAHEGNLTRAAERLGVAASALSAQIRELEARLGHALFERRGRRLLLTEAGRIALDHADAVFSAGEELVATLRGAGRARQVLRVGAQATLSRNFLLGFLRPVLGRPDSEVVIRSGGLDSLLRALEALDLDVVLAAEPPAADAARPLTSRLLAEEPVSVVARPALLAGRRSLAAQLAAAPLVLPAPESGLRGAIEALCERLGVAPAIAAEADDMAMLRLLVREGVGIGLLPAVVVRDELVSGALVEGERLPGIAQRFHAVTTPRRFPNPMLRDVLAAAETARGALLKPTSPTTPR
jgi:LysR family transcriptional activator of nhaA